jgi:hypothetical protein
MSSVTYCGVIGSNSDFSTPTSFSFRYTPNMKKNTR